MTDLKNEVKALQDKYTKLEASLIFSNQEQERVDGLVRQHQDKLLTINEEITQSEKRLKHIKITTSVATKNLSKIGDTDRKIRESLATKEMKLLEEKTTIRSQKAEMKKDLLTKQQLQPKVRTRKYDGSKGYYKI